MKEDSQIKLLSNLSSQKGGKQSASAASSYGHSISLLSSSSSSRCGKGRKCPYSSSPARSKCLLTLVNSGLLLQRFIFSELGAMSLIHQSRRLSVPLLVHLEGQGCRFFGGGGVTEQIFDPLRITSSSLSGSGSLRQLLPFVHQGSSSAGGNLGLDRERSCRTLSSLSGVLQPSFCCDEGVGLMGAHHRPLHLEQVRSLVLVQDGDQSVCSQCHSEGRLDVLHRPEGCLPSSPCPFGEQEVPLLRGIQKGLPIQGPVFRPLHGSPGIYQGHGSCIGHSTPSRGPDTLLSGGLASTCLVKSGDFTGEELGSESVSRSWHYNQPQEILSFSFSDVLVSRHDDQESDFWGFPNAGTHSETSIVDRRISVLQAARRRLLAGPVGLDLLSLPTCSRGSSPYEVPPAVVAGTVGLPRHVSICHLDTLKRVRSVLVVVLP